MPKKYIPVAIQRAVIALSQGYCEYCVVPSDYSTDFFNFDHIQPTSQNGTSELDNLARSCGICNGYKHDKTKAFDPLTKETCRLFHPRQDNWKDHFEWSKDSLKIIGKTAIGRTTVDLLPSQSQK
jgi:5-methylcytosine-specific restriction endonuclease McrA